MTLTCDDRPGIVAAVSSALLAVSANIVENQQYSDEATGLFFMRTVFDAEADDVETVLEAIRQSPAVAHQHRHPRVRFLRPGRHAASHQV